MFRIFILLLLTAAHAAALGQCGDSIDLSTWIEEGDTANGNWGVTGGGNGVNQSINGDPTFYVSPDSFINVRIAGDIRVNTTADDDWIGFVFGYQSPDTIDPTDFDFYLFAWKQSDQNFSGFFGSEGYTFAKVDGPVANLPQAFSSFAGPYVDVVASSYGNTLGWADQTTYSFVLTYTNTRAVIAINGDTIFDEYGCFPPGRFGFYNYSQSDVTYSNFTYRVAAAFNILTPDVCAGDTAQMIAVSDSCPSGIGDSLNNTITDWDWDFGDGNTSTDTNASHVYDSAGTYLVRLVVTDYLGCTDTAYNTVDVFDVSVELPADTELCSNETTVLSTTSAGALSFLWSTGATASSVVANAGGTYTVTATGTFGCTAVDSIVITDLPVSPIDLGPDTVLCANINIALNAAMPGATYLWHDGSTDSTFSTFGPGSYHVTLSYATGCTDTDTVVVTNFATPVVSPPNPSLCHGDTLMVTASGADTYQWFPAAGLTATVGTSVGIFSTTSTSYSIEGTDTNGCVDTATFDVTVTPLPTATLFGGGGICLGDTSTIGATFTGSGIWEFTLVNGSDTQTFSEHNTDSFTLDVAETGTYIITSLSDSGCASTGTGSATVFNFPSPSVAVNPDTSTLCIGSAIGLNATGAASYHWLNPVNLSSSTTSGTTASPVASILYQVEGTDANGCLDTGTAFVNVVALPTVTATPLPAAICIGDAASITANGALTYAWTANAALSALNGASVSADPLTTDTFTVYGTDANGCVNSDEVAVVVNPLPVPLLSSPDSVLCLGETASLNAQNGVSYQWSPATGLSAIIGAAVNANPAITTLYAVTVTDGNGCENTDEITVVVNALPVASINPPAAEICFGSSQLLLADGGQSYAWSPASGLSSTSTASTSASPTANATYTVTATDNNGCTDTASIDILVNPLPVVTLTTTDDSLCFGDTTVLVAGGAPSLVWTLTPGLSAYSGSPVVASPTVSNTYTVGGTDANGCFDFASIFITVSPLPTLSISPGYSAICNGDTQSITVSGAATYAWSPGTSLSDSSSSTVQAWPTDTTLYTIDALDVNQCTASISALIDVKPLPVLQVSADDVEVCTEQEVNLQVDGAASYSWTPTLGMIGPNTDSPVVSPASYEEYTVVGTSTGGCVSTASIAIYVHPIPNYSAGPDTEICEFDTAFLHASGGVGYQWQFNSALSSTAIANPTAVPVSTNSFRVTITDQFNCRFVDELFVVVNPLPTVRTGPNHRICPGESVVIGGNPTGDAGTTFQWSPGATLNNDNSANPSASPDSTTTYFVTVTNGFGCQNSDSLIVFTDTVPRIDFVSVPDFACRNEEISVVVTTGLSHYQWTPQTFIVDTAANEASFKPSGFQAYTITARDGNGCVGTLEYELEVRSNPKIDVVNMPVCGGDTGWLVATGALTYEWGGAGADALTDSVGDTVFSFADRNRWVTVTGTDTNGCMTTDSALIEVHPKPVIDAGNDILNCTMQTVWLGGQPTGSPDLHYSWQPAELVSDSVAANPSVLDTGRTMFYLKATSPAGCVTEDSVFVNSDCYESVFIPSAFTPDGNGFNDVFLVSARRITEPFMQVRDRWGHIVFESNDLNVGWTGTDLDLKNILPMATYYYYFTYRAESGRFKSAEGTISLIR